MYLREDVLRQCTYDNVLTHLMMYLDNVLTTMHYTAPIILLWKGSESAADSSVCRVEWATNVGGHASHSVLCQIC